MRLNQILTIVFLVLLVPSVIKCVSSGLDITTAEERPKLFDGYNKDNIAVIEITKKVLDEQGKPKMRQDGQPELEVLSLVKSEGKWMIGSGAFAGKLEARSADVESMVLDPLGKIEKSASSVIVLEADDPTLARYELDEDHATTVRVGNKSQQAIATLLIGRSAGGVDVGADATSGTYVRTPKDKIVILTDESLKLETGLDSWVNKTLLDISDEKEIRKLTLRNEKGELSFEREADDKPWKASKQPEGTGKIRDSELTSLLSRAKYVSASSFVEIERGKAPPAHGLNSPKIEVQLETKDKKAINLRIGNVVEGKEESYAHLSTHDGVLFTMQSYDVDAFKKDPREFFDPAEAPEKDEKPGDKPGEKDGEKMPADTKDDAKNEGDGKKNGDGKDGE